MTDFTDAYVNLLIKQYWEKPNAVAEIAAQAASWEKVRDILAEFMTAFDLDTAVGAQLDIIGRIAGLPRNRIEFDLDDEYRFYIRMKIAKNTGSALMVSNVRTSIQAVIQYGFEGLAYVLDQKDMTLQLYIDPSLDLGRLALILELDLLPKPQGVRYSLTIQAVIGGTFGFANNLVSKGFASKTDVLYTGGIFARKVFI